jgi:hypothetical protein
MSDAHLESPAEAGALVLSGSEAGSVGEMSDARFARIRLGTDECFGARLDRRARRR